MARARNIKPGFFKNEDLAECSPWARLCFAGLWTLADREGRLEDRAKRIKGELFAYDSIEVEPLLVELEGRGFLVRYRNSDGSFIQISKFSTHQTPHYSEKPSVIKAPGLQEFVVHQGAAVPGVLQEDSEKTEVIKRGSQPPDSLIPDSRKKTLRAAPAEGRFPDFWSAWPATDRRTDRKKCLAKWRLAKFDDDADEILAHIAAMKQTRKWQEGFEPAPLRYLNGEQWKDGTVVQAQDRFAGAI